MTSDEKQPSQRPVHEADVVIRNEQVITRAVKYLKDRRRDKPTQHDLCVAIDYLLKDRDEAWRIADELRRQVAALNANTLTLRKKDKP